MENNFFWDRKNSKDIDEMAPPVMLAQLIQALYNVVDSFFVGRYSESGLTALSIIYPIQLLMIALAVWEPVWASTPRWRIIWESAKRNARMIRQESVHRWHL